MGAPMRDLSVETLPMDVAFEIEHDTGAVVEIHYVADHHTVEEDLNLELKRIEAHYTQARRGHMERMCAPLVLLPLCAQWLLAGNDLMYGLLYFPISAWLAWHQARFIASHLVVQGAKDLSRWFATGRVTFVASPALAKVEKEVSKHRSLSAAAEGIFPPMSCNE